MPKRARVIILLLALVVEAAFGSALSQRTAAMHRSRRSSERSRAVIATAAVTSPSLATRSPPPLAKNVGDVIRVTVSNFATVGAMGFAFSAITESISRGDVAGDARKAVPALVIRAALMQGQRWGRVSAGFAGGRAIGQVWRGVDDRWASMCGAIGGGALAATSLANLPSSVATFCAFTYFIDSFTAKSKAAPGDESAGPRLTPGQKLDKMLGTQPQSLA